MPSPQKETLQKGEKNVSTKYLKNFKGVYTKATRVAIPEDNFYDLVNLMPIGAANLHSIPDISAALVDYAADSIYWIEYANINSTDFLIAFASNGKVFAYNIGSNTRTQINVANLLSGGGSRMDQWKNQLILFYDSNGYFSWDGTTFTGPITGGIIPGGAPTSPDIAVFSNRVWLYSARALYVSAINSTTDFTLASGAITQNITDPQLRGESTRLFSANGYLYILGKSSIFVISDVYIPTGASPPAPVFSILNVQAIIGCDNPASVFVFNRDLCFANSYGFWKLTGVTAEKLSEDIDGTFQYIDTTFPMSGGSPKVNGIIQASFLMKQLNDPSVGTRVIVASVFDKKWWFTNYGALTFVATAVKSNQPVLFGLLGNKLYQLYQNSNSGPASSWLTALWPMEDQVADKEVFRAGFEMTIQQLGSSLSLNLDTPNTSTPFITSAALGTVTWQNNSGQIVAWQNNLLVNVGWYTSNYLLYYGDGQGGFARYVGLSGSLGAGSILEVNSMIMDYSLRTRWSASNR
jgi:hypothetical protein